MSKYLFLVLLFGLSACTKETSMTKVADSGEEDPQNQSTLPEDPGNPVSGPSLKSIVLDDKNKLVELDDNTWVLVSSPLQMKLKSVGVIPAHLAFITSSGGKTWKEQCQNFFSLIDGHLYDAKAAADGGRHDEFVYYLDALVKTAKTGNLEAGVYALEAKLSDKEARDFAGLSGKVSSEILKKVRAVKAKDRLFYYLADQYSAESISEFASQRIQNLRAERTAVTLNNYCDLYLGRIRLEMAPRHMTGVSPVDIEIVE